MICSFHIENADEKYHHVFAINGSCLLVGHTEGSLQLDFETGPLYALQFKTVDSGNPPMELITVKYINLTDVKEVPEHVWLNGSTVSVIY